MAQDKKALIEYLRNQKELNQATREQLDLLKSLEKQQRRVQQASEDTADSVEDFKKGLDDVGEAFGLRLSQAFDVVEIEVQQAKRDIATMFDDLEANAPEIAASIAEEFNSSFREAIPTAQQMQGNKFKTLISDFKAMVPEMGSELEKAFATGDIANFYKKFGDDGMKKVQEFLKDKKGFGGLREWFKPGGEGEKRAIAFRTRLEEFEPAAQKTTKVMVNWGNILRQIGDNILNYIGFGKIIKNLLDFDNKLSNIKREFQIPTASFGKASAAMSGLVRYGAQFGLDNEKAFKLVKDIGEYAKTTNIQALAATAKQVAAVSDATGIALETVGQLTGQMMFFGASAEKARGAFTSIMKSSNRFGVNVTAVAKQFQNVFPRFARMGFKGGEESLARMAAKAEKMGTDINKLLDASDKFLDINSALEASADLSLLGGAAAQTSFTDLMRAAQDGPEAMDKLMTQMTSDIGKLNSSGKLQLSMIDRQKINQIATLAGEDVESVTNRISSRLQDAAKKAAIPPGVFNSLSDEEKDFLLSKVTNVGGKWKFEGLGGITDLKNVSKDNIQAMMNKANSDAKNIESAAKSRQSLEEKLTNLANTILAEFTKFQPYLEMLKQALDKMVAMFNKFSQVINNIFGPKYGSWVKTMLLLGGILMLTFGPSAMLRFGGILFKFFSAPMKLLSGLTSKMGAIFKGGGAASKKISEKIATQSVSPTPDIGKQARTKTPPSFLQQFSKISPAQILSVAAALIALGIAFMFIGKGIQFAATGLATLVKSFNDTKNAGMALAAVAIVMGGFVGMLAIMIPIISALGAAGTFAAPGLLALGAAFLGIGAAIFLASKGFSIIVNSFMQLGKYSGSLWRAAAGMIVMGGALAIISPALLVFGAASLIAVPGMLAFGYLLRGLGAAKGVNPGLIKQIGNSMGSIAWGLVKLGLAAGPAVLAMVSAGALMMIAVALKNLSVVDVKKVQVFGQSLAGVSMTMIKGLVKLGLVAPFAVLAMVSAGSIWLVSKALANITPVDLKKLANFGDSMGMVGSKMIKGLIKLGLVSPFALVALVSAGSIWLISKALANITPIDLKKLENFGDSMGMVGIKLMAGLIKLGLISPFVVLGVVSAGGINLISRLLKNIPLIDMKTLNSNAVSLNSVSWTYAKAFAKLLAVAVLTPTALVAAGGIWLVAKLLKNVPQLNSKALTETASVVSSIGWPFVKAFGKLQIVSVLAPLAVLAALGILGVTKALNSVPKLNADFLKTTANILNQVSGPFAKSLGKLGLLGAFTPLAIFASNGIVKIADVLSKIKPLNSATLISVATTLSIVSKGFSKGLLVLGLLGILAAPAIFAASSINKIANSLTKVPLLDSKKLISTAQIISQTSTPFLKGLAKFALLGVFAIPAMFAAKLLQSVVKILSNVPRLNPVNLIVSAQTISRISTPFLKGLALLALTAIPAAGAMVASKFILSTTRTLSNVPMLNPVKLTTTAQTISKIAWPFLKGLGMLALVTGPAALSMVSANFILGTTKILSAVPMLNPVKLITTAQTISKIAWPFLKGLGLLAIVGAPALLAMGSSLYILGIAKILSAVPMLNPVKLITTAQTISKIAWPFLKGLGLLALTLGPSAIAMLSSVQILATTKLLSAVPMLNPVKLITTAQTISKIALPFLKGLGLLALTVGPSVVALASATFILGITKILSAVPMLNSVKLISTAQTISKISMPFLKGLGILGLVAAPSILALVSARMILGITRFLSSVPVLNPAKLIITADTINKISKPFLKGLAILGLVAGPAALAFVSSKMILGIANTLRGVNWGVANSIKLNMLATTLNRVSKPLLKGLLLLGLVAGPAGLSLISSKLILGIANNLRLVPMLNPVKLITTAQTISKIASPFLKGLIVLGLTAGPAALSLFSSKLILSTTRTLSLIPMLNPVKLITTAQTISKIATPFLKGLALLSLASAPAAVSLATAKAILGVSRILAAVPMLNAVKLITTAKTISKISVPFLKGLAVLGLVAGPAALAFVSSKMILRIANTLLSVEWRTISSFKLNLLATTIERISRPFLKGLALLGLVAAPSVLALLSSKMILNIAKVLNLVPLLTPAKLITTAQTINLISKPFLKGLAILGLAVVPAALALVASRLILTTTRFLSSVPTLNPVKLITTANVISKIAWPFLKGLGVLGLAVGPAGLSLIASRLILSTTKILATMPMLNSVVLINNSNIISKISRPFLKGLTLLGLVAGPSVLALVSSKMILQIAKTLLNVPMLNYAKLLATAQSINLISTPLLKGLFKLGLVAGPSILALLSSKMVLRIANILNTVPLLNPTKLLITAQSISNSANPLIKGLTKFALISAVALPAIVTAYSLLRITKILSNIPILSSKNLIQNAFLISNSSGIFAKGLLKLSLISAYAIPATIAALALKKVIGILTQIPILTPVKFINISSILNNTTGPIIKGLGKLAGAAIFALPSYIAAQGLNKTTQVLSKVPNLSIQKFLNMSFVLNNLTGPIVKGLIKFSALSSYALSSYVAAMGLKKTVQTLSQIPVLLPLKFKLISDSLNYSPTIGKGLTKLAELSSYVITGRVGASTLDSVVRTLSKVPSLSVAKFRTIVDTLNLSTSIGSGLSRLSKISAFSETGVESAKTLKRIVNLLQETKSLSLAKFQSIVSALSLSNQIMTGLTAFSRIQSLEDKPRESAKVLAKMSNQLTNVKNINSSVFQSMINALNLSSQLIAGLNIFSKIQSLEDKPRTSAKILTKMSNELANVKNINPSVFQSIVNALNISGQIMSGLKTFSKIESLEDKPKDSARVLTKMSNELTNVKNLNSSVFQSIVNALSLSPQIITGLRNFSKIESFEDRPKTSAKVLTKMSNELANVKNVNSSVFQSIINALNLSGQIVTGLKTFSKIQSLEDKPRLSAKVLTKMSNELANVKNVNSGVFQSIISALNLSGQVTTGLNTFIKIQSLEDKPKNSAKILTKLSNELANVKNLNTPVFQSIVSALNFSGQILTGLNSFVKIQSLEDKPKNSAKILTKMSNELSNVKNLSSSVFQSIVNALNLSGQIMTGLNSFVKIQSLEDKPKNSAKILTKMSNELTNVKNLSTPVFQSIVSALNLSGPIMTGLNSFIKILSLEDKPKDSAKILTKLSNELTNVKNLKPAVFQSIVNALNFSGQIINGLAQFSKISAYKENADSSADALKRISKTLTDVRNLKPSVFQSIVGALNLSGQIVTGLGQFSKIATYKESGDSSASALKGISKTLTDVRNLKPAVFQSIVNALNLSGQIVTGLGQFSKIGKLKESSNSSANTLQDTSKILTEVRNLKPAVFQSIVDSLNFSDKIYTALAGFSKIKSFEDSGKTSAETLKDVVQTLAGLKTLNPTTIQTAVNGLNFSGQIYAALSGFSKINKFEDSGPESAKTFTGVVQTLAGLKTLKPETFQTALNALNFSGKIYNSLLGFTKINSFEDSGPESAKLLTNIVDRLHGMKSLDPNKFKLAVTALSFSGSLVNGFSVLKNLSNNEQAEKAAELLADVSKDLASVSNVAPAKFNSLSESLKQSSTLVSGLKSLSSLAAFTSKAESSAGSLKEISTVLANVVDVPQNVILNLANTLSSSATPISSGLGQIGKLSSVVKTSKSVIVTLADVYENLQNIASLNLGGLTNNLPTLNSSVGPITEFSKVGNVSGLLKKSSEGLASLARGLSSSTNGFMEFSTISWSTIASATPILDNFMSSMIQFGSQGTSAATGIIAMAGSMDKLGKSMQGVASGFGVSTKSMAAYNNEKDKLKTVATAPKPAPTATAANLKENVNRSAAVGAETALAKSARQEVGGRTAPAAPQIVQIKPIQIELKLDGKMIQKLIVDANYNRS